MISRLLVIRPAARRIVLLILCAAATLLFGPARTGAAAQIDLSNAFLSQLLVPGAYAVVGTERYDNFSFTSTSSGGALLPDPSLIQVKATGSGSDVGLFFQSGPFVVVNNQIIDSNLSFNVTELDPTKKLISAELKFTGGTLGGGSASVLEVVRNTLSSQLGQIASIQRLDLPNGGQSSGTATFAGQSTIEINKDIALIGTAFGTSAMNMAQISDFTQTFNQTQAVPEPASFVMMAIGASGVSWIGWRRKKKSKPRRTQIASATA